MIEISKWCTNKNSRNCVIRDLWIKLDIIIILHIAVLFCIFIIFFKFDYNLMVASCRYYYVDYQMQFYLCYLFEQQYFMSVLLLGMWAIFNDMQCSLYEHNKKSKEIVRAICENLQGVLGVKKRRNSLCLLGNLNLEKSLYF